MKIHFASSHSYELLVRLLPSPIDQDSTPKAGQIKLSYGAAQVELNAALPKENSRYEYHKFVAKVIAFCRKEGFSTVSFDMEKLQGEPGLNNLVYSIGYAANLGNYAFDRYLSEKKNDQVTQTAIIGLMTNPKLEATLAEGIALGLAVNVARDLANERSHNMTPMAIAEEAKKLDGMEVEVLTKADMEQHKMGGMLSVSQGAYHEPAFIIIRYTGDKESDKRIGLVGKGITYDSGGLSLKPATSLPRMHADMSGAAATVGAMFAIAAQKLKVNITATIPACENMLSNDAYRPGDIITVMAGKTVLIKSTDAEGRLVMVDALHWLHTKENINCLIDIATLTGGATAACGPLVVAAAMADGFCETDLDRAACDAGNLIMKMPLPEDYMKFITDDQADLVNSSNGQVSMICAALFLKQFTGQLPWLHLDIAGSATADPVTELNPSGATGIGTALLYHLVCRLSDTK